MMQKVTRRLGLLILLTLILSPIALYAQEDTSEITVIGSGIVEPLFQALITNSETELTPNINITGTNTGFAQFCAGEADITLATRQLTAQESENCIINSIGSVDFVLGHDIAAFVVHPAADYAECLTNDNLNLLFAPSAQNAITNWNQVFETGEEDGLDAPLTLIVPDEFNARYAILDSVIEGDGIRNDVTSLAEDSAILDTVSSTEGAVGVVSLQAALNAGDAVKVLTLDTAPISAGCRTASAQEAEDGLYTPAQQLRIYVNTASLTKAGVADFLTYATSEEAASTIEEAGFTAPTSAVIEKNVANLEAAQSGETIVSTYGDFQADPFTAGQVAVAGAANLNLFITSSANAFTATNTNITIDSKLYGETDGFRRLCNGEVDIVSAYRDLNETEAANCAANNIDTHSISLGSRAVVLIANANDADHTCLSIEEIANIWQAGSTEDVTLFAPLTGNTDLDLLLALTGAAIERDDVDRYADALYRAAATGVMENSVTVLSWNDYQRVLNNNQENIQLVEVNAGSGCVAPSIESINDGSYGLARASQLIISKPALARAEVQAFAWHLISDASFPMLEANGFVGLRLSDLAESRSQLQRLFLEAEAEAAVTTEVEAEATEEAETEEQPEVEAEATEEPVEVEAEAEATEEAGE